MFRQIGTPSERDLTELMGDDYIREWDQGRVTQWLEEHGWSHIAPKFREAQICGKRFFQITLSDLVETLPRPITTYADRRRLLNEIRAIGRPADVPYNQRIRDPNIHIDTNLPLMVSPATNSSSSGSQSPVRAHTPLSAHLSDTSPVTPSSLSRMTGQSQYDTQYEDHVSSPDSPVSKSKFRNSPSSHSSGWSMFSKLKSSHHQSSKNDSSGSVPVTSSPTLTDSEVEDYAKIAPFIPSRTSSTPDKISKILGSTATNFIGYNVPPKLVGKTAANSQKGIPKSASYQPSYTRIPQRHAHTSSSPEQRIQVTDDGEVWYSLIVTDLHDSLVLKESILKKIGLKGDPDRYLYYHENGTDPDVPLQPQHLIHLCRMADYSAANRILVKPAKQSTYTYLQDQIWSNFVNSSAEQKQLGISGPQTQDGSDYPSLNRTAYGFAAPDLGASPSPRRNQKLKDAYSPTRARTSYLHPTATPSVFYNNLTDSAYESTQSKDYQYGSNTSNATDLYVSPVGFEHKGVQLSDPPTPQNYNDLQDSEQYSNSNSAGAESLFDNNFDSSFISPAGQYNINEAADRSISKPSEGIRDQDEYSINCQKATPPVNFWAVQPNTVKGNSSDTSVRQSMNRLSLNDKAVPNQPPDIPRIVTGDISGPNDPDSSSQSGSPKSPIENPTLLRLPNHQQPDKFWGERPPVELMQQYLDKYFSGHDLDKEIIVETPATENGSHRNSGSNLARQQPLRHKKSIRVVAKEASRKWLNDGQVNAPTGNMLRRKSTKMWGQRVVQVKPGQATETPTVERTTGYFGKSDAPVCTKMQWIRGALIGKGSFGRVYHAFNVAAGDFIAVKQVDIPKTSSDLLSVQQKETVEALYQEITLLKDLDHEHVVEYLGYDNDETEGVINIFLEYVSGGSISSRLARHGAFEEPVVRHFTRQILLGLEYLHDRKILHRDIKGANILVEQDGICKISDFGLSKKNDYENPMAPEMVKSEAYSAKVDIWSTGCTVIEMFTGQRPWLALNQLAALYNLGHYNKPPIPENISEEARQFLDLCLTIDPDKRPTAADLLAHPFCRLDPNFEFTDYVSSGKI
ncbi:mitogen-activated protein kinase kinase kinase [Umbelopsis sp. WA50703]